MARATQTGSRTDFALLAACGLLALLCLVLPAATRYAIAASLQRTVAAPFLAMQARAERARSAFSERERLTLTVDSLTVRVRDLQVLDAENAELRGLLSLSRAIRWGFIPAEALNGNAAGDPHTLLLTAGANAGVALRSAVVAPAGLVGLVSFVGSTTSNAMSWSHPDFRVSAMAQDGSAFGIVSPHLAGSTSCGSLPGGCETADRYLLELRGVPFRGVLKPGTIIASSGLGGVFPRGIPIGTVMGEIETPVQWTRTYLLRPAMHPRDITSVLVLSPQQVARDSLENAWATPSASALTVDGIVRAADSVRQAQVRDSIDLARPRIDSSALLARPIPDSIALR